MNRATRACISAFSVIFATGAAWETAPHDGSISEPKVIVLGGGPLHHRVVLTDLGENLRLMLAATEIVRLSADSLSRRPRIRLVMYWGDQWSGRSDLPDSIATSMLGDGAQPGAFYPAFRGRPALWEFGAIGSMSRSMRRLSREGVAILAKRGVPVAID